MPRFRYMASALLLTTALAVVGKTREAGAQTLELPRNRQGYYLGGGLNFGAARLVDDGDTLGAWFALASKLHAGQMLTEHLGLGLNLELGSATKGPRVASVVGLGTEAQWEVLPNLALKGGFGFGVIAISNPEDSNEEMRGSFGGRYTLAVSYDWFPGRAKSGGFAIAPVAMVRFLPNAPVSGTVFTLGVEFNWWKGLPKNELELPAGEGYEKK